MLRGTHALFCTKYEVSMSNPVVEELFTDDANDDYVNNDNDDVNDDAQRTKHDCMGSGICAK